MTSHSAHRARSLGRRDIVLFTVSAILLLETLTAAASIGSSSVTWWLLLGLVFFLPFAMICAEMGCTYPEQGGIYAWVRDAFGPRWGSRASWAYWVNTAVWLPAIYILFAGIFKQLFYPDLALAGQIALGVALVWISVALNAVTLDVGKWVPNLGAMTKILIFLVIMGGAVATAMGDGVANPMDWASLKPSWSAGLQYIPAIIYGMLGFELISAGSEELKDPGKDIPAAVFWSALIIIALYTGATLAVLVAIPAGEIDLVEGLMDTLGLFLGDGALGRGALLVIGAAALYTFFANGVTWALGCNRAACEAAREGELPGLLAIESPSRQTPIGAAIAMGVVATSILILYGFLSGSNEELFWSLFAFSAVIFLLPYLGMLLAFTKSRLKDLDRHRPYRVPGPWWLAIGLAWVCIIVLALSIFLFVYTPGMGFSCRFC